jgi:hypothetical protein
MTTAFATTDDGWRGQAACRHADPDLFFPKVGDHQTATAAVAVCPSCPVIDACLRDATRWPAADISARLRGAPRLEVRMATSVIRLRHGRAAAMV